MLTAADRSSGYRTHQREEGAGGLEYFRVSRWKGAGEAGLPSHEEGAVGGPFLGLAGEVPLREGAEHLGGTGEEEEQTKPWKPLPAVDWLPGYHRDAQQSRK